MDTLKRVPAEIRMTDSADHKRTIALAEVALAQIKALKQSAHPRNYEIWYNYAAGHIPSLNHAINDHLTREGAISAGDLDSIYESYLSSTRFSERIESVSSRLANEIDRVRVILEAAAGSASSYSENLAGVSEELVGAKDLSAFRSVIERLAEATRDVEEANQLLEARLRASNEEISLLHASLAAVRAESLTDPLTSLSNRKYFDQILDRAVASATRTAEPFSLILADIDHFKTFNDTYGHPTGDQVLRLVAHAIKQNVKGQDITARYGGEEFAVILPETSLRQAMIVGDHIRRAVVTKELIKRSTGEHLGRVTVSVGIATFRKGDTTQSLIERADGCLYEAKRSGRNRVVCEANPKAEPTKVA